MKSCQTRTDSGLNISLGPAQNLHFWWKMAAKEWEIQCILRQISLPVSCSRSIQWVLILTRPMLICDPQGPNDFKRPSEVSQCFIQGKSFIKDALKCMAHGLRHKFSCISRKCVSIKEMVFQLQRECYMKHNLCSAAKENVAVMVEMIHFQDLFPKG